MAFGRKIAAVAKLSASEAREKKQIVGVRNKLLRSFEVERQRITSNDAVGANTARAALRDCATTADLRQALNFVEDQGALSGLALLQMKLAYMDSPGWLEAQMASDNRKLKRAPRPAEHERRQVKKVRAGLQTRGRRQVEQITQALVAVLRKNLGHVPLPECLRRWGRFVRLTKAERVRSERTWRQTDAIMEKRAARMDSWRSRAHIVMRDTQASPDTGPAADAAAAAGEGKPEAQPTFGIGNNAEGAGAVERPQLGTGDLAGMAAGFPSTELQLQLIACRHAPEGTRRRTLAAQLQRDAHAELLRRCGRTPDEAVRDTSTWLEQNGVPARGAGGEPLTFAAGNPAVVSAPHPPALTRAAAAQQTPVVHADEDKREMQKVADVISAVVKQARTGRPDILVVLDRPLREIDEAIVKLAVGEAAVGVECGSPRGVGGRGGALRWRPQSQKKPSMICNLGLRFDNQCEELLEVIDGSAAAAAARTQEQLRPGIFLTHVQGTVLQWAAVHDDAATAAAGCAGGGTREQPRAAQVNRLLTSALESGESLRFGFTAQPLHVYRVLHNGTVAAAATAAAEVAAATASGPRPTPPGSPTSGHRPPLSARAASRPTSATVSASASAAKGAARRPASAAPGYRTTTRPGSARPAAAAEAAGTRPLGSIARRQRPASARPDFGRATIGGSSAAADGADDDDAGTLVEQSPPPQPGTNAKGDELVSGITGTNHLLQKKRPPSAPATAAAAAAGEESEKEEEGDAPADHGPAGTTDTVGGAAVHRRLRERPSTAPSAAACTPRAGRSGSKAAL